MNDHGIWIVDHNHMIRYIPTCRPPTRTQRLGAWFKAIWHRLLIWLAVLALLAGWLHRRPQPWPHLRPHLAARRV